MPAIKYRISKLDDVPEALREYYKADGNEFILDGAADREAHVKAIENNRTLNSNLEAARTELATMKTQVGELSAAVEAAKGEAGSAGKQKSELEQRLETLEKTIADKEAALQAERESGRKVQQRDAIKTSAANLGAKKRLLDDIATLALADGWGFDENGQPVRTQNGQPVRNAETGNPQTYDEYLKDLVQNRPDYFDASGGDGAGGDGGAGGARKISAAAAARNLSADDIKAIASGEATVG
jgi:hypothetical protein